MIINNINETDLIYMSDNNKRKRLHALDGFSGFCAISIIVINSGNHHTFMKRQLVNG